MNFGPCLQNEINPRRNEAIGDGHRPPLHFIAKKEKRGAGKRGGHLFLQRRKAEAIALSGQGRL
jgi:hypothetical protein